MAASEPHRFSKLAEELIGDLRGVPFNEPARMRKRPTHTAGSAIEALLTQYQIGQETPEDTIRSHWAELVGAANAHYSHAAQIDARGRLLVIAAHAVVRNELFFHRQTIVERIRELPGCKQVRAIEVRSG